MSETHVRGTEDGEQADWLAVQLDRQWRYDHTARRWHHWNPDTGQWAPDKTQEIRHAVDELALSEITDIAGSPLVDEKDRTALLKVYRRLREKSRIDSALDMLATHPEYATDGSDWDQDPYLIGVANGVVDLRYGKMVESDPANLVSRTTGVVYRTDWDVATAIKKAKRFWQFLAEVTSGDPELALFYLRWFGYGLFGLAEEQRFLILTGLGRNGKGALTHAVRAAVGEYMAPVDSSLYMQTRFGAARSDQARADLMALKGKRIAVMSEPEGGRFNEELLKAHTGGDPITARALNSNNVLTWTPTHSITFLTNTPPSVDDIGPAMASRVMVADFRERYEGDKEDKRLYEHLTHEAEAILFLLVNEAGKWWRSRETGGLVLPQRVIDASHAYISANDALGDAMTQAFVVERGAKGHATALYDAYIDWFEEVGRTGDPLTRTEFGLELVHRGFQRKKTMGVMVYSNIRPKGVVERIVEAPDDGEETH